MPLNARSSQSTQKTRTQKKKHGRRGARDSEDEADDAPANTQAVGEDDDLDQPRGVNNEVGGNRILPILQITSRPPRKQTKRLGI